MTYYTDPLVTLLHGDCIEVMATLPADSVDAVVTDPPYGLEFMGKEWDRFGTDQRQPGDATFHPSKNNGPYDRATVRHGVYSGKTLDAVRAFQAWCEQWGREALRVTKPGGYLLSFGGTRTHHRLVCALEDAGWIIRDELDWIYASGFPKGKANLKPAHEPIVLARKPGPLRPLAIDESRIDTNGEAIATHNGTGRGIAMQGNAEESWPAPYQPGDHRKEVTSGRWPSNVLLSDPELFDEPNPYVVGSGTVTTTPAPYVQQTHETGDIFPLDKFTGGYSRFFIVPKADRAERERGLAPGEKVWSDGREKAADYPSQRGATARANAHPTVKPLDLMRHLVRLVTPSGGTVLDPFLGSGTTCLAASELGVRSIGIEREAEYLAIAKDRLIATPMGLGLDVLSVDAS